MLNRFRGQDFFDPRDPVYGIFGFTGDTQIDGGIPVDYESSVEGVYKATTRHIIQSSKTLEIFCNTEKYTCKCQRSDHNIYDLPSWVKDWRCLVNNTTTPNRGNVSPGHAATVSFSADGSLLTCKGLLLGSVKANPQPLFDRPFQETNFTLEDLNSFSERVALFVRFIFEDGTWYTKNPSLLFGLLKSLRETLFQSSMWIAPGSLTNFFAKCATLLSVHGQSPPTWETNQLHLQYALSDLENLSSRMPFIVRLDGLLGPCGISE